MCGIAGFLQPSGLNNESASVLRAMTDAIWRRGPDDEGHWLDSEPGIALGQRRLSIIDLSPAGHQPMVSHDGRLILVLNGEIYNYREIRDTLSEDGLAPEWKGSSDTEVLLAALSAWGIEKALSQAVGMFALALWDRNERTLYLARDRMGEKPLYYGWQGTGSGRALLFGSDLAAFRPHPAFRPEVDRAALNLFMRHNYVPAPRSIYAGVQKLMPGQWACFRAGRNAPELHTYWDTLSIAGAQRTEFAPTPEGTVDELERLLSASVKRQMIADVPLGAFLSGGIDSSTIVALMQAQSSRKVKTFTIGFSENAFNEAVHAKAVADHLGTDHTELYIEPRDALDVIPNLADFFTEPFADSSQIPTYLVSRLARESVTVSLSGDAGDELFGGYNRYLFAQRYWKILRAIPRPLRALASRSLLALPPAKWDRLGALLGANAASALGHKIHKGAALLERQSIGDLYMGLISHFDDPSEFVVGGGNPDTYSARNMSYAKELSPIEWMMAIDSVHYLPDDILVKVDRAAMAVSLETRVPLLDPNIVSFAWQLPLDLKIRDGQTKWPLRQLLFRHVPRELIERPKMGFGIPIAEWLRGPLRDWAENLLEPKAMCADGFFVTERVQGLWRSHLTGRIDNGYRLWSVLMFQDWHRR